MTIIALVIICILAIALVAGGILFALTSKQTGYAAFGVITAGLILLMILAFMIWFK